ncbi:chorismate pyruvate-lyase family protein [uncultured Methanobrevibacter sp.]|uniref:chorismate pyruvate-lyase family protein n=1 Tax=uncultured Methanobrevibacter sp. TaxID=253161 RepID=UPI00261E31C9|nr:chorismate pyruvate-lyase family protein [uncultured Methanobrevibacter sp.]
MNTETETKYKLPREKIIELEEKNNIKLSTVQKILCAIEGQVVTILDALYGDVNLFILDQHMGNADKDIAEKLEINEGDEIDSREVIIHKNARPLVYGLTYIPKDRCSNTVIEKLLKEDQTTGRILVEHQIETITKITDLYIEKPTATLQSLFHTSEDFIVREYVLIHKKNIVIWSKEAYPISYFQE